MLNAIAIRCSLQGANGEPSLTERMIGPIASELTQRDVAFAGTIRSVDQDVKTRVSLDEGRRSLAGACGFPVSGQSPRPAFPPSDILSRRESAGMSPDVVRQMADQYSNHHCDRDKGP